MKKSELIADVHARLEGFSKSEVRDVVEALGEAVAAALGSAADRESIPVIPGYFNAKKVHKPARKSRMGTNPFTGERMKFKAKPAHNVVKVRALKKIKDEV